MKKKKEKISVRRTWEIDPSTKVIKNTRKREENKLRQYINDELYYESELQYEKELLQEDLEI